MKMSTESPRHFVVEIENGQATHYINAKPSEVQAVVAIQFAGQDVTAIIQDGWARA